ncbi:MAG: hypothetical protein FJ146_05430 [Deltaproteobacteria bacterium]|nr:hypothetical protein [Deltaproteobacteria bacterium]
MARFFRFSTKMPWLVVALFCVLAGGVSTVAPKAQVTARLLEVLPEKHPAVLSYQAFQRTYEAGDMIAITLANPTLFARETLTQIRELTTNIEAIVGITGVTSLTTLQLPNVVNEGVEFAKLVPDEDFSTMTDADLAQIREKAMTNLLVSGNLLNKEGTTTAIFAETKANLSKIEQRETLALVKAEVEKFRAKGADIHISSSGFVEVEVEGLQSRLFSQFWVLSALGIFLWLFMTLGSVSLAGTGAIFAAVTYLIAHASLNLLNAHLNTSYDMISAAVPTMIVAIAMVIATPILVQFQQSLALSGNKTEAIATSFLIRQSHLVMLAVGIALIALVNIATGFSPLRTVGIAMGLGLGVSVTCALLLLPALLAVDLRFAPSHQNVKLRESMKQLITSLHLRHRSSQYIVLFVLMNGLAFGLFSASKVPFETTPVRFLQNQIPAQRELEYFNKTLGGPEMIDVEATLKDPNQNFFQSGPLKSLNEVQKNFNDRFSHEVSRTVSIADYFKELHKAFTPGVTAANAMPEKEEDYKNYADLLELSDGKMLGKMVTIDKLRARMMVSRRLVGWDVARANAFIDNDIPQIANGTIDFKVAGLAGFIRSLDDMCRGYRENLMYACVILLALVAGTMAHSFALGGILGLLTLGAYVVPMIGMHIAGSPINLSAVFGQSCVALACLAAVAPIVIAFHNPLRSQGTSWRHQLWQAAVYGAPEVLVNAPLIGLIFANLWFSGLAIFGHLGMHILASSMGIAILLALALPLVTGVPEKKSDVGSSQDHKPRPSHAA